MDAKSGVGRRAVRGGASWRRRCGKRRGGICSGGVLVEVDPRAGGRRGVGRGALPKFRAEMGTRGFGCARCASPGSGGALQRGRAASAFVDCTGSVRLRTRAPGCIGGRRLPPKRRFQSLCFCCG